MAVAVFALVTTGCSDETSFVATGPDAAAPQTTSQAPSPPPKPETPDPGIVSGGTIAEVAEKNNLSVLLAAVEFAGLAETLDGKRKLTAFAPTNAAFVDLLGKLGLQSADQLLVEENRDLVRSVLLYHVAPGPRTAKVVFASGRVNTLQKEFAFAQMDGMMPQIGNEQNGFANIVAPDVRASNGVVHVIDAVLLPPSLKLN